MYLQIFDQHEGIQMFGGEEAIIPNKGDLVVCFDEVYEITGRLFDYHRDTATCSAELAKDREEN